VVYEYACVCGLLGVDVFLWRYVCVNDVPLGELYALAAGVPKATILTYFYPEVTAEKMSSYRMKQ